MARRARKGVESTQIMIIAAVVVALGGLAFVVASRSSDKFAGLTPLPIGEYMRNANSLSGNSYKLEGTVGAKARYTENNGQIIIVEVEDGGSVVDLGVYVPVDLYGDQPRPWRQSCGAGRGASRRHPRLARDPVAQCPPPHQMNQPAEPTTLAEPKR